MKKILSLLVAMLFAWILVISAKALDEVAVWKAENIESAEGRMNWPDSKGENTLVLANTEGVSLGEAPTIGNDQKSVVFSGTQKAAFASRLPFPGFTGDLEIKLLFKPGVEPSGTIIRFNRQWQLGLKKIGQKNYVELMVWHESGGMTFVPVEVQLDKWQEITATVTGNVAKISCDGKENSKQLTEAIRQEATGGTFYIGLPVATPSAANKELATPLCGAIADLRVSM